MPDVWEFRDVDVDASTYSDGTVVPHLDAKLFKNGKHVGAINVHMHKRRGPDKRTDTSFGATHIIFGEAEGGS